MKRCCGTVSLDPDPYGKGRDKFSPFLMSSKKYPGQGSNLWPSVSVIPRFRTGLDHVITRRRAEGLSPTNEPVPLAFSDGCRALEGRLSARRPHALVSTPSGLLPEDRTRRCRLVPTSVPLRARSTGLARRCLSCPFIRMGGGGFRRIHPICTGPLPGRVPLSKETDALSC